MKKYFVYTIILITVFYLSRLFMDGIISTKKESLIKSELNMIHITYNGVINSYRRTADVVFENVINKPETLEILKDINNASTKEKEIIRNKLYLKLFPLYESLVQKNFRQLHFHTKDNTSLLRFNEPKFYGENLSLIRKTVSDTNKNKKSTEGFENGRTFYGYRFVYPLIYNNEHLGSVELSFSIKAMTDVLKTYEHNHLDFLIKQSALGKINITNNDNYKECSLIKDFVHSKDILATNDFEEHPEQITSYEIDKNSLLEKLNKDYQFSDVIYKDGEYYISSYYPVKNFKTNHTVGFLGYISKHNEIKSFIDTINIVYVIFCLSSVMLFFYLFQLRFLNQELSEKETTIKELNKDLKVANKELEKKYRNQKSMLIHQSRLAQMGEMFSMIVHQIKQPLNSFSLSTSMLSYLYEYEPDNKEQIEQTKVNIRDVTIHTNETIDNFRNFYKTEKDKREYKLEDIVNESLFVLEHKIKFNLINIEKELENDILLNTYNNHLKQVFVAIISNAIDAIAKQEEKNIFIKTYMQNNEAIIEIKDNGSGIPLEIQENIFDPYYTTKADENGTGLGLYMSKMIVEDSLKGKINFTTSSEGTIFRIELIKE